MQVGSLVPTRQGSHGVSVLTSHTWPRSAVVPSLILKHPELKKWCWTKAWGQRTVPHFSDQETRTLVGQQQKAGCPRACFDTTGAFPLKNKWKTDTTSPGPAWGPTAIRLLLPSLAENLSKGFWPTYVGFHICSTGFTLYAQEFCED